MATDSDADQAATSNVTDLRRARQRARAAVRTLQSEIEAFLTDRDRAPQSRQQERRLNEDLTALASSTLRQELEAWLVDRGKTTMARAIRAALSQLQQVLPGAVDDEDLFGSSTITPRDQSLLSELRSIDAGLLYQDDDALAEEVGNRITRQLRLGFADNEGPAELARRVEFVLTDGDGDGRQTAGVTGQTIMSKAELIAHDSVQDAYVTAAHRRYLQNGFRFVVYDAVLDVKTSDVCRRLDEVVVDIVEDPWLIPPNHPWCRSGMRPLLELGERDIIRRDDIADDLLGRIASTNSYRPTVLDTQREYRPTALTDRFGADVGR
jgi:hypothetical protein